MGNQRQLREVTQQNIKYLSTEILNLIRFRIFFRLAIQ